MRILKMRLITSTSATWRSGIKRFQRIKTASPTVPPRLDRRVLRLQDDGYLEILTTAATHAYLPLLARDSSLNGDQNGSRQYRRLFGRAPRSLWLPEYGYWPAPITETGRE